MLKLHFPYHPAQLAAAHLPHSLKGGGSHAPRRMGVAASSKAATAVLARLKSSPHTWRQNLVAALWLLLGTAGASILLAWALRALLASNFLSGTKGFSRLVRARSVKFRDPTFGAKLGLVYSHSRMDQLWEDFLDGLGFTPKSPIRQHVRQLFSREDLEVQFRRLFDALSHGNDRLTRGDFLRFSRGISGHVHVLLKSNTRVPLSTATVEDHEWIENRFDTVFPSERPLDRETFPSFAKLVLLRRVVRTLIVHIGLDQLQAGVAAPLVVDISVDLELGQAPFRLHTVAPSSQPNPTSGEIFPLISEESTREHGPMTGGALLECEESPSEAESDC